MCHLVLLLPVFGVGVFWLMPADLSIPLYAGMIMLSGSMYWLIVNSLKMPSQLGPESLVGAEAEVIAQVSPGHESQYLVKLHGELWTARSSDPLTIGQRTRVLAVKGIHLQVEPRFKSQTLESLPARTAGLQCH